MAREMLEKAFDEGKVKELADAILRVINEDTKAIDQLGVHHHPEFEAWIDKRINERLKVWIGGILLAYLVPMLGIAYGFGALINKLDAALEEQQENTLSLQTRALWIRDQENFNCEIRSAIRNAHPGTDIPSCDFPSSANLVDTRR